MSSRSTTTYSYQSGFGNTFETEALPNALPSKGNNPQANKYNLVTEQISGTAFTVERGRNLRSWLYRIRPSTSNFSEYVPVVCGDFCDENIKFDVDPNPLRWKPLNKDELSSTESTFLDGLKTVATSKSRNISIYMYNFTSNMSRCSMLNSDGDFLIVPQLGSLSVQTEMGMLQVDVGEIVVIPRGIVFRVTSMDLLPGIRSGYMLEVQGHFYLPELGPIGSNGLANARDFLYPVSHYEDLQEQELIYNKFDGKLFKREIDCSPFNVVAWHGNYAPFKYDLDKFNCINSVNFDHPDPSIYTVLTCPSNNPGTALADFVIFPPRWMCAENTFRPPWYHRNCMTEFMGLISGSYDAKTSFVPGGASLHSMMTPHGPDVDTFKKATLEDTTKAKKFEGGLAFMFETCELLLVNREFLHCKHRDYDYVKCWHGEMGNRFNAGDDVEGSDFERSNKPDAKRQKV